MIEGWIASLILAFLGISCATAPVDKMKPWMRIICALFALPLLFRLLIAAVAL